MQGPYGFQEVIDVNSQTQFNGTYTLATVPANAIVSVEGTVQADGSILASGVEVITTNAAFISGRILAVNPGPQVTMFVGEELPNLSPAIPVDTVYTVDLSRCHRVRCLLLRQLVHAAVLQRQYAGGWTAHLRRWHLHRRSLYSGHGVLAPPGRVGLAGGK